MLNDIWGLPANIFYGTSIPTCILVLKKCKETEDLLFVDASTCFQNGKNQNSLGDEDVARIVEGYRTRAEEDRFSHRANLAEITENEFNLNIPRYVDTFEPEEPVNLEEITQNAEILAQEIRKIDTKLFEISSDLGVEFPNTANVPLLKEFKRGLMQRLFSRELRFMPTDPRGNSTVRQERDLSGEERRESSRCAERDLVGSGRLSALDLENSI